MGIYINTIMSYNINKYLEADDSSEDLSESAGMNEFLASKSTDSDQIIPRGNFNSRIKNEYDMKQRAPQPNL